MTRQFDKKHAETVVATASIAVNRFVCRAGTHAPAAPANGNQDSIGISEEAAFERHAADYALKRVSTDEDVANACLFLASDVSRQITGVDLPVDGGWAMR